MKLNRYWILGASLLVPALTMAASFPTAQKNKGEWYVGLGAGPTVLFNTENTNDTGDTNYSALGVLGGLFGGYAYHFDNRFNLGGEIFGDARSAKYKNTNNYATPYRAQLRYSYGLRIMPGYQVNPRTSLYALLGYVRGNFKSTWSAVTIDENISNLNGFQVGVGSKLNLTTHFGLRGDVIYSQYQNKTFTLGGPTNYYPFKNSVSTLDGIVSLVYSFA